MSRSATDASAGWPCCTPLLYDALDPQDGGVGVYAAQARLAIVLDTTRRGGELTACATCGPHPVPSV